MSCRTEFSGNYRKKKLDGAFKKNDHKILADPETNFSLYEKQKKHEYF